MSRVVIAIFGALALATVASGAGTATPGVSPTEVVIGGTIPLTGVASAYRTVGLGAAAYFRYVNAHGGVNHRKIRYIIKDDAYDPGQTMAKTRELVEQDHVFAIFNSLGTEHNLATRPYLNALKVAQLFLPRRGDDLRALRREDGAEVAHRRPLPERRLRQGPPRGPAQRARQEEADRLDPELQRRRSRRPVADRQAEVGKGEHADALRDAEVRDSGLPLRVPARLAAEGLHQHRLERVEHDGLRAPGVEQEAARGDDLDRLHQGPHRSALGQGPRDEAVSDGHEEG